MTPAKAHFHIGDLVVATGLVNAQQLNGKIGKVARKENASGRVAVKFVGCDGDMNDNVKMVALRNSSNRSIYEMRLTACLTTRMIHAWGT